MSSITMNYIPFAGVEVIAKMVKPNYWAVLFPFGDNFISAFV
jgi:hypothetical protein